MTESDAAPPPNGSVEPSSSGDGLSARNVPPVGDPARSRRSRKWLLIVSVAGLLALVASVSYLYLTNGALQDPLENAPAMEAKYDGKLARGDDGDGTACADGNHPKSQPVQNGQKPPVADRAGRIIGYIELRTSVSKECPPVIWAWVVWNSADGNYVIPEGLTLQVDTYRPDTDTIVHEPEKSHVPIQYAYSAMLVTLRGCAQVIVYFTDDRTGEAVTTPMRTACVSASQGTE